jgi:methylmalonyl-CoA/ethylmalonyl-CoA epimerase
MKILRVHHIAVAVDELEKYQRLFEQLFGIKSSDLETNPHSQIELSMINFGNTEIEFLKPLSDNSAISKFLEKRGPGIHHVCLEVDDINSAIAELKSKNVKMIDETPRNGGGNSLIAFIHPQSTGGILIELKQEIKRK